MTYAVVYASATGNTKMLAEEIRRAEEEEICVYFGTAGEEIPEADLVFAGFWTDKGDCSEELAQFLDGLHGRKVFLFGTAGFGGAEEYFASILERVKGHLASDNEVVGTYMCQGRMPQRKAMIENFDRALEHPDQEDLERLRLAVEKL